MVNLLEELAFAITSRTITTAHETIEKKLDAAQVTKACEALMKAIYGTVFEFIVRKVKNRYGIVRRVGGDGDELDAFGRGSTWKEIVTPN